MEGQRMKAMRFHKFGGPELLRPDEVALPLFEVKETVP
jgi:hypothetical protein